MTGRDKMRQRILWAIVMLAVVLMGIALMRFNLTALHEPGPSETRLANLSKRYFIYRASRHGIPPRPQDTKASTTIAHRIRCRIFFLPVILKVPVLF